MTAKTIAQHEELMKKTETMNVLIETNKMLREEKERLEQELQQIQAKVGTEAHIIFSDIQADELFSGYTIANYNKYMI